MLAQQWRTFIIWSSPSKANTIVMFSLEEKKILIVGATSDIGESTAMKCAKLGGELFLSGRNLDKLQQFSAQVKEANPKSQVATGVCDLMSEESIVGFVEKLPRLDGIVFVAGTLKTLPCKLQQMQDVMEAFEVNFNAIVLMMATLMRLKKVNKGASIIFISSVAGNWLAEKGNSLYGASKAALSAYAKTLALELAGRKIRVNSMVLGMVKTKFLKNFALDEENFALDEAKYPLGYGAPDDVSGGVVFLLSDESRWVTGTNLLMDGGRTLH